MADHNPVSQLRELLRLAPPIDRHFATGGTKVYVSGVADRFLDDLAEYLSQNGYVLNAPAAREAAAEELGGG